MKLFIFTSKGIPFAEITSPSFSLAKKQLPFEDRMKIYNEDFDFFSTDIDDFLD
jgi:hypothetical protein